MLNILAVAGQAPVVSLRSQTVGDESNSLARCATAALQSRTSASVEGGRWVAFV